MTTKEKLLNVLEVGRGEYFSGEELAGKLNVSRAAIWKAVKTLRQEGYDIDAVTNKGYSLSEKTDILSPQGIRKYLSLEYKEMDIKVLPCVGSTNTEIREMAERGMPEGYTLITNEQTAGRGRLGRTFYSPCDTGLYLSVLLRPVQYSPQEATMLTALAAVAMCEAIEVVSGEKAAIKWVNDIFVKGKKVCGILTEASFGLESGTFEYVVLGAGVNVYPPTAGFPSEIEDIAGAITKHRGNDIKNRLVGEFISRFMECYHALDKTKYIEEYKRRNLAAGSKISVISGNNSRNATVCGIDNECHLSVRYDSGETEVLSCGEIQIRI